MHVTAGLYEAREVDRLEFHQDVRLSLVPVACPSSAHDPHALHLHPLGDNHLLHPQLLGNVVVVDLSQSCGSTHYFGDIHCSMLRGELELSQGIGHPGLPDEGDQELDLERGLFDVPLAGLDDWGAGRGGAAHGRGGESPSADE